MLAHFAMRLVFGICLMLVLMPRDKVPSAFFRILMLIVLGLSVLAATGSGDLRWLNPIHVFGIVMHLGLTSEGVDEGWWAGEWRRLIVNMIPSICAGLAFLGSIYWSLERRHGGLVLLILVALVSGIGLLARSPVPTPPLPTAVVPSISPALMVASEIVSAGVLGAAMTAMLLGHRYLTAPGMPLDPLRRVNQYLGGTVLLRAVLSGWGLALVFGQLGGSTHITWLALRWLAGIIGPAIVVVMVHHILKYKNTQAATGVLFVGVILTFIGELTADLLFREVGVPL